MKEINLELYTDYHFHPDFATGVEFVGYQRRDGQFDIYIYEPAGSIPEFEEQRCDEDHVFVGTISSEDKFWQFYDSRIKPVIGLRYEIIPFFREKNSRKICGRIYDELVKAGCRGMSLGGDPDGNFTISLRRKDFEIAQSVTDSNL